MEHPKNVGDRSTLAIMAVLHELGYPIYVPFSEHTRCDLIIEAEGVLRRIQCKTGRLRDGSIRFAVCSTYGHYKRLGTYVATTAGKSTTSRCSAPRPTAST
jgi:PD-(D/E)XK nuclease superfamily protein